MLDTALRRSVASRDLAMRISGLDLAVIVAYLLGITLFGIRFRKRQQTIRDYFLGGREFPWWALALSIVATETSTLTVIGTPALAFTGNLGFLQVAMGYLVARVVICLIFIPQYFRGEFYTAYELIQNRFGARMRAIAASTFLVTRALAEGVRVSAFALVVRLAFGTGETESVVIITLLTLVYTFHGGMTAVIWTDVIQLVIYLAGAVAAFFLLLHAIPGGWTEVAQVAAAHGKFQFFDFTWSLTQTYTFWAGIVGGTFLTTASHGTDQLMVQRLLAARNARESRLALLTSGVVIFAQFALFLVIGVMLYAYHGAPEIVRGQSYDWLLPEFIITRMPPGMAGLMIAAVFAAAMSTTSGTLNSLASSTMVDLLGARRSGADAATFLRRSRYATLVWGAVLLVLGTLKWGPLLEAGLTIASVVYGSLLGLFLLGILNRRATANGALAGMMAGLAVMLYVKFRTPLAWTWYVAVGTVTTFAAGSLASLMDLKPRMHADGHG